MRNTKDPERFNTFWHGVVAATLFWFVVLYFH